MKNSVRVAVVAPKITTGWLDGNVKNMLQHIRRAASDGAELVLLPEMALSGLVVTNNVSRDFPFSVSINSDTIKTFRHAAKTQEIWVAFGFFESDGMMMYNSAILIDNTGKIVLHYRRISKGWLWKNPPHNFGSGEGYPTFDTPWGKVGFLIGTDLFDPNALRQAKNAELDLLLLPMSSNFEWAYIDPQMDWEVNFWPEYQPRLAQIGATTLMSNFIEKRNMFHGGAFITNRGGELLAQLPLYTEDMLNGTINAG
ncbi:MAG: carbon-nitrogen hydrolase family protein [Defluviitaleaceae bacterium]|nr:carbon-nitrogen hydrolase family protein [Defluviitaleaceae bacterium]